MAQDSIRHTTQTHQLKGASNFAKMKLLHSQSSFSVPNNWNMEAEDHHKNNFSLQGKGDHCNDGNLRLKLFWDCSHVVQRHFIIFMFSHFSYRISPSKSQIHYIEVMLPNVSSLLLVVRCIHIHGNLPQIKRCIRTNSKSSIERVYK